MDQLFPQTSEIFITENCLEEIPVDESEMLLNLLIKSFVGLMSELGGVVSDILGKVSGNLDFDSLLYDRVSETSDLGLCNLVSLIWNLASVIKDRVSLPWDLGSLPVNLESVIRDLVSLIPSPGLKSEPGDKELSLFLFRCFLLMSTRAYSA